MGAEKLGRSDAPKLGPTCPHDREVPEADREAKVQTLSRRCDADREGQTQPADREHQGTETADATDSAPQDVQPAELIGETGVTAFSRSYPIDPTPDVWDQGEPLETWPARPGWQLESSVIYPDLELPAFEKRDGRPDGERELPIPTETRHKMPTTATIPGEQGLGQEVAPQGDPLSRRPGHRPKLPSSLAESPEQLPESHPNSSLHLAGAGLDPVTAV